MRCEFVNLPGMMDYDDHPMNWENCWVVEWEIT